MDIIKLSQLGESGTLEYKRNTDSLVTILKTVSAFANTAGGIILIGVEDDGKIVGVPNVGKAQEQLSNSISNRIKPQLISEITVNDINNMSIISIQIDHSPAPYYLSDKGEEKGVYIRVGNSNRLAGPEVIGEIKRSSNYSSFDKAPCDEVAENDLDKNWIKFIYSKRGRVMDVPKLISMGLLTKRGRRTVATNGGVILFGFPEIRETCFPYAEVRCARFKGISRSEFIDRLNIKGGILAAIDEVPKFIRRNTKMAGKFGDMRRRDIPEYPVEGIREALTNAIAHANYEITGSRIFIALYDDRLEIQNPGIMMPGMSMEQFKAGVSRIRNPVIAKTLAELELIEEWGSGYKRIKNACKQGGYPLPTWEEFGSVLRVTFYPHPEIEQAQEIGTKSGPSWDQVGTKFQLSSEELQLLSFCLKPKTVIELMSLMGWKSRTKFREKFIGPLMKYDLLEMTIPERPRSSRQKYRLSKKTLKIISK